MIDNLISFLGTDIELNPEEVSDLLWLILERQKRSSSLTIPPDQLPEKPEEKSDLVTEEQGKTKQQQSPPQPPRPAEKPKTARDLPMSTPMRLPFLSALWTQP